MAKKQKKALPVVDAIELRPDRNNPNRGSERGRYAVEKSLERYGAGRSIVLDKSGNVIAGNKTLEAALENGFQILVVDNDDPNTLIAIRRPDLDLYADDDGRARGLSVADNRAGELGLAWDPDALRDVDPTELDFFFSEDELARIVDRKEAEPPDDFPEFDEDIETEHRCPSCGYEWSGKSAP